MKKVGLCIAYRENHTNYGTALLGFATQKMISNLGYENEVIIYKKQRNYIELLLNMPFILASGGCKALKNRYSAKQSLKAYPHYAKGIQQRIDAVNAYKEEYILPNAREYCGFDKLQEGSKNYSTILVGSDQVWLPLGLYSKFFNLLFVDKSIPRIAYSSSFGVSQIPWFQKKQTGVYLNRFDAIAVREIRGKEIVEELSDKKAEIVVDPTLLVSREDWEEHIQDCKLIVEEKYIFCYFLGTNMEAREAVNELQKKTGFKVVFCPHMDEYIEKDDNFGDYQLYDLSPADFVNYIKNAEYVCTDSFHATIFSIHFEKQFLTFYRFDSNSKNSRNSRIDSLFSLLSLQERLYSSDICNTITKQIDYQNVNSKLEKLIVDSKEYLITNLKKHIK